MNLLFDSILDTLVQVDMNFVRHDQPGYNNPRIAPGDRILQVDGKNAEHVHLEALHKMLKGPLHSIVTLVLVRAESGEKYSVSAIRHGFRAFDNGSLEQGATKQLPGEAHAESLYNSRQGANDIYVSQRSDSDFLNLYGSQRSAPRISPRVGTEVVLSNPAPTSRVL